jgi:hypothetical protein
MKVTKWSFPILKASRWSDGAVEDADGNAAFEDWILWVRASDLPTDLPLDPNARHPDTSAATPKAIAETLRTAPAEFVKRNGGLTMVARSCRVKDNVATLHLNEVTEDEERDDGRRGDGILNGGHTYAVLKEVLTQYAADPGSADDDDESTPDPRSAVVRVEVQTGLAEHQLPDISRARNKSTPVAEFSLKNLGNAWQAIKKVIPSDMRSRVAFMENDPDAPHADYDVGDLVRLLALFNNRLYPITTKDPIGAYTSEKRLITSWEQADYQHLLPHLATFVGLHDEVVLLYPEIMKRAAAVNGVYKYDSAKPLILLSGKPSQYFIPPPFTFPVLAALRAFLADDGSKWLVDPHELIPGIAKPLVQEAWNQYRTAGKNSAAFFGRNRQVWRMLALTALVRRQS